MPLITESNLRAMLSKGVPNPFSVSKGDYLTPAAKDFLRDRGILLHIIDESPSAKPLSSSIAEMTIPVGVSNRHVHLSQEDVEKLFGKEYTLTPSRYLSQPGQFAAEETVSLIGPKGIIQGVRILGPARGLSQVEISRTDGFTLGVHPPVRLSGSLEGTPGITLVGPKGCITLSQGLIVAKLHVHMSPEDAKKFQVEQDDTVILRTMKNKRSIIYTDVAIRISSNYLLDFHADTDEGNAADLKTGDVVQFIGKNGEFFSPLIGR